jgi:hypothetical protein
VPHVEQENPTVQEHMGPNVVEKNILILVEEKK